MKKTALLLVSLLLCSALWSQVVVDGSVGAKEYDHAVKVLDGTATVFYSVDQKGGVYFALSATTTGWVGLGLGSQIMDGATIFMGSVKNGKAVFSEQKGRGHSHSEAAKKIADSGTVAQTKGVTSIEFHVPASALPFDGKTFDYIVAFADAANLSSFHEDNETSGTITLP